MEVGSREIGSGLVPDKGIESEYVSVTNLPGPGAADAGEVDNSRVS